jgi:hypothetical protein
LEKWEAQEEERHKGSLTPKNVIGDAGNEYYRH